MKRILLLATTTFLSFAGYAIGPITGTASVCAGSTSTLSDATSGGTWSSSATAIATIGSSSGILAGVAAGTATISYTDGISTATITATVNPTVTPTDSIAANAVMPVCTGSRITFTSYPKYGGTAPIYQWKRNGLPIGSAADTFSYIAVDGDIIFCNMVTSDLCPSAASAISNTIVVSTATPITPVFTISAKPWAFVLLPACDTFKANVVNDGSVYTYQWSHAGIPIPGATSDTCISNNFVRPRDSLSCTVTGCGGASATVQIVFDVIREGVVKPVNNADNVISLYPNPATNEITATSATTIHQVIISNLVGKTIYTRECNGKQVQINTSSFAKGIYFIKVNGAEVRRFVKE